MEKTGSFTSGRSDGVNNAGRLQQQGGRGDHQGPEGGETGAPASDITIEIVAKGFQHDFWQAVLAGSKKAEAEFGVKTNFVGPEGEGAIAAQVEQLNNAINKNPNCDLLRSSGYQRGAGCNHHGAEQRHSDHRL